MSNTDNASIALRKELLQNCNLHTVLDLPGGTFIGAGVKTVVLFFEKGKPTQKVWYYQLNPSVKRNIERFPELFRFQLTDDEKMELVTNCDRFESLKHASNNPLSGLLFLKWKPGRWKVF